MKSLTRGLWKNHEKPENSRGFNTSSGPEVALLVREAVSDTSENKKWVPLEPVRALPSGVDEGRVRVVRGVVRATGDPVMEW